MTSVAQSSYLRSVTAGSVITSLVPDTGVLLPKRGARACAWTGGCLNFRATKSNVERTWT